MIPFLLATHFLTPREDFLPAWKGVESAIRTRYYARVTRRAEMERLLAKYAPMATAAQTRAEFDSDIDQLAAEFHDSHFDFLTNSEQGYYLMDGLISGEHPAVMPQFGAWFHRDPDGYTVQMVLEGGAAAKAGLRPGDRIDSIDGEPFTPIDSLRGRSGKDAKLSFTRGTETKDATVRIDDATALKMFLDATVASQKTLDRAGKRIGYFHLWTLASDEFRSNLKKALEGRFAKTDAFILDLRGGFGGRPQGYPELFDKLRGYAKPLVILIDRGSRSAKEVLSYQLQKSHRATLVGETTAGHVLGTFPQRINDWSYIEIPVADVVIGGVRLEGKGVSPDVPVATEEGKDLPLERALQLLTAERI